MTDRAVVDAAIKAWTAAPGTLAFEAGKTYDLGTIAPPNPVFWLEGVNGGVIDGRGANLQCRTLHLGKTQMFLLRRCRNLTFRNLSARDVGYVADVNWQGMDFIHVDGSAGGQGQFLVENVMVSRACSFFTVSGTKDDERVSGITIRRGVADRCYYALNLQENGDNLTADIVARNCRRVYYPYGVRNHRVSLDISHDGFSPSGNACILISRGLRDTADIDVVARFSGFLPWTALARFEHKSPLIAGGVIEQVSVELDVAPSAVPRGGPIAFIFSASNEASRPDRTPGIWRNIRLFGRLGGLPAIKVEARPNDAATVSFTDLERGSSRAIELR